MSGVTAVYPVEIKVSTETMMSMLSNAFDCGDVNYWVSGVDVDFPESPDWSWATDEQRRRWGDVWQIYTAALCGGKVTLRGAHGDGPWVLDKAAMIRGLEVMAAKCPRHFQDMITGNDDSTTGDVYVQCCVLGEVVYG